ncbi:hypothetical protein L207DRAFT_528178 [Hyaloscypha variabilis F]|uniref:Uncharacterized protein n=1 Tax=Hyaloscypha variabilis (strain UAMH 11265 / GT02V1 / F) TaxID=1149755 RepID=A0A2J6RSR6_HYAVF|nr:hypothetical protein L207DRAFT_528178 [Hyaloscypha variabilis F]
MSPPEAWKTRPNSSSQSSTEQHQQSLSSVSMQAESENVNLNSFDRCESDIVAQNKQGISNHSRQFPTPQIFNSDQQPTYDEDIRNNYTAGVDGAQDQVSERDYYGPANACSTNPDLWPQAKSDDPHFDNNYNNDNYITYSRTNPAARLNGNSAMDPSSAIGPTLNQMGVMESEGAEYQMGEEGEQYVSSQIAGTSRIMLQNNRENDYFLGNSQSVRASPIQQQDFQFQGIVVDMGNMHPATLNPHSSPNRVSTPNTAMSLPTSFPSNASQYGSNTPSVHQSSSHQQPIQIATAVSQPVNPVSTPLTSGASGGKKLKISRHAPYPYTEANFIGIRRGGKRMTHKSPGEWNAEAKANHYPFFLAYHGRPAYQPATTSNQDYINRSRAAKALSMQDKALLLDFIRANKYWCKHKKLPNPPNVVLVSAGNEGDASDVEDELPDPDETDGDGEDDAKGAPSEEGAPSMNRGSVAQLSAGRCQSHREARTHHNQILGSPAFPNLEALDEYLLREGHPSALELVNQFLESKNRPIVRLIKAVATPSPSSSSSASSNTRSAASQYHVETNMTTGTAVLSENGFGASERDAAFVAVPDVTNYSPNDDSSAGLGISGSSRPCSANLGKRNSVDYENGDHVSGVLGPVTKKIRSNRNQPSGPLDMSNDFPTGLPATQNDWSTTDIEKGSPQNQQLVGFCQDPDPNRFSNILDNDAPAIQSYNPPYGSSATSSQDICPQQNNRDGSLAVEPYDVPFAADDAVESPTASPQQPSGLFDDYEISEYFNNPDDEFRGPTPHPSPQRVYYTDSETE